jgi:transglutaminase-like putative cysteine protease
MIKIKFLAVVLLVINNISAQVDKRIALTIPKELKENANSVIRLQEVVININSRQLYTTKTKRIVTVLNEYGNRGVDASEYYSKSERIKNIEATIYDAFGKEIKKIRKKDFKDQSIADGFSVLTDGRILYLDFTPTQYPYTIEYTSEVETINTAFLPSWTPIERYLQGVEHTEFTIFYPENLGFKYKLNNFDGSDIVIEELNHSLRFIAKNITAEKREENTPDMSKIFPMAKFSLEKFNLEGVEGTATSWEEFGKVWYRDLVEDKSEISKETINKIKELTKGIEDPIEKAKIVYQFVQSKTRYVSIQLGIGGWKPMLAKDVDRLGYGDCKALSNYTRILLENVGVPSYYTVIYGDSDKRDFDKDFVSQQGNHVILSIPYKNELKFLECTSQTSPFAYGGDFTDDRYALLIKPEGGEIVKTNEWNEKQTIQSTNGTYTIDENGKLVASFTIESSGLFYEKYQLKSMSHADLMDYYKSDFSGLTNLKITKSNLEDNREQIKFIEQIEAQVENYVTTANQSVFFVVNAFNRNNNVPKKARNRKHPFEISRGFQENDTFEVNIPKGYKIDFLPEDVLIQNEFGLYKVEIKKINDNKLTFSRVLEIKKAELNASEFEKYRIFRDQIARHDNAKIVLTK